MNIEHLMNIYHLFYNNLLKMLLQEKQSIVTALAQADIMLAENTALKISYIVS